MLPATASKFGGTAYCEQATELDGGRFLGQINFAEATGALHEQQFPIPTGMPAAGLLAVDLVNGLRGNGSLAGRTRWYPAPRIGELTASALQTPLDPRRSWAVARYEAAISFIGSWSMQGLDWYDVVDGDRELWDYMNDLEIDGVDVDAHGGHKLFGHANEALNEHYGLTPAPGRSAAIRDYALVWRIDADSPAGFHWGTNWLYVVIHKDDLGRGAFEHAIVTGANA